MISDLSLTETLFNAKRVGKLSFKPRPVLVQFSSLSDVKLVLKTKLKLHTNDRWHVICIGKYLILFQRERMRERDSSWIIKYMKANSLLVKKKL